MRIAFSIIACALLACCAIQSPQAGPVGFRLSSGFKPSQIPGLQLWLDASQIVGLNDGDAVGTWNDLSGNGNDATQGTASKQPTFQTNEQNGKPGVQGDGVDDVLDFASAVVPTSNFTIYFVGKLTSSANTVRWMGNCDSSSADGFIMLSLAGGAMKRWILRRSAGGGADITLAGTQAAGTTYCNTLTLSGAGSTGYVNGVSDGTSACTQIGSSGNNLQLFNDGASTGGTFAPLLIFEVLVYNTVHNTDQRSLVHGYLQAKWAY